MTALRDEDSFACCKDFYRFTRLCFLYDCTDGDFQNKVSSRGAIVKLFFAVLAVFRFEVFFMLKLPQCVQVGNTLKINTAAVAAARARRSQRKRVLVKSNGAPSAIPRFYFYCYIIN